MTGRYVSSCEAAWRLNGFDIHQHNPTVQQLVVHLENGMRCYFDPNNPRVNIVEAPKTHLTEFFKLTQADEFAATLLYRDVPRYYRWLPSKEWKRRQQGEPVEGFPGIKRSTALGRLYTVHPSQDECFHLRLLLQNVEGPKGFEDLRVVDGERCQTFKEACLKRGLLKDDKIWEKTMEEASSTMMPRQLRQLFMVLVTSREIIQPHKLWMDFRDHLSEDFLYQARQVNPEAEFDDLIYSRALTVIEDHILSSGGNSLDEYGFPPF